MVVFEIEKAFIAWRHRIGQRKTVREFCEALEISQTIYYGIRNNEKKQLNLELLDKVCELSGYEPEDLVIRITEDPIE